MFAKIMTPDKNRVETSPVPPDFNVAAGVTMASAPACEINDALCKIAARSASAPACEINDVFCKSRLARPSNTEIEGTGVAIRRLPSNFSGVIIFANTGVSSKLF